VPKPDQKPAFPFRLDFPPDLPISARAEEIVGLIQTQQVVILAGETGSGKTTQIPKMCLAAGGGARGRIACTQPRRVAALSVSRRVAEELGVEWGGAVGCKIRFDDRTSRDTVIKFLTDGMLLAEVQGDPMLRDYDTIILDEAHERSLNIDFLLGHLRTLRFKRPELKIIITSATIDTAAFSEAFDGAPVVEVSGRTYPVEVVYSPLDALGSDYVDDPDEPDRAAERSARVEALHYVDGAAGAIERLLRETPSGDVLVFLPSERDIREVRDLVETRDFADGARFDVVPLFGRLSNADQQRVFAASGRRKVILATNIAETSLTIPGIRFVVDTGLARISRYSPQARTRRLPIEPVSQSSADQRKGRAGRVAAGLCIRLYSEKDYLERPRFTQPEIQRANLADVILRLKAYGLGDIERFPFINPPAAKAIRAGYALLEEVGALAAEDAPGGVAGGVRELTPVGRELARMPVDPTVGRMILQARTERCLREVVVIAAGLSIQDPRERPLDKQTQADAAHQRFRHPDSDFLTLLAIWDAFHDEFERLSQARLRRFCHDHFLSYVRLREWRDIHAQLMDVLEQRKDFRLTSVFDAAPGEAEKPAEEALRFGTPAFRAIHRSILSGLLGNLATYDEENRLFKAAHDRRVTLFPGSVLFRREEPKRRPVDAEGRTAPKRAPKVPRWIMASEIVETSRLFARTCARVDPGWVLDLGSHLLRSSHSEPLWNAEAGRVMVKRRTRLYGLELEARAVSFGPVDPVAATQIFIREGLIGDTITWPFDFLASNRKVRAEVESLLTRTRNSGFLNLDEALYRFYAARLLPEDDAEPAEDLRGGVSSVAELIDLVRGRRGADPRFLLVAADDLRDPDVATEDEASFPASLPLENRVLPLQYAYRPGQDDDGVQVEVNVRDVGALTDASLDWAVPGHLRAKVEHYLRALPKEQRRLFVPLAESVRRVSDAVAARSRFRDPAPPLQELLAEHLAERFGLAADRAAWAAKPLPPHLQVRVRVVNDAGEPLVASRSLAEIRSALASHAKAASLSVAREDPEAWRRARQRWERPESETWTFGAVPASVKVSDQAGVTVEAFPALAPGDRGVALRLVRTPDDAQRLTRLGVGRLLDLQLGRDLGWLEKELRELRSLGALLATLTTSEAIQADAFVTLRRWVTDPERVSALDETGFTRAVERARTELRGIVPRLTDLLRETLQLRQELLVGSHPYPGQVRDVEALLPANFVRLVPYERLVHLPRYLRAMRARAERWKRLPAKDAERARQVAPYLAAAARRAWDDPVRWLVEEFRVSVFAQELGTAEPVSAVKLDRALAAEQAAPETPAPPERVPRDSPRTRPLLPPPGQPSAAAAETGGAAPKRAPLKDLNALGNLFRR